jgi:predicted Zn-dependent protease with MMP-like domain/Flp pilus assembly protein TadD
MADDTEDRPTDPVMEAIERELEAGWSALDEGDLDTARRHAQAALAQAQEGQPGSLAQTLVAAIAATEGDLDKAQQAYEKAHELDPEAFEPLFQWAQLAASAGELEEALELAEDALDNSEEEDEYIEALLLKTELELGLDDLEAARETLGELPPVRLPDPQHELRAAEAWLELDDLDQAAVRFTNATELVPTDGSGWHGLGLVAERHDDEGKRLEHFLKVRELDLAAPSGPYTISTEELEDSVEEVLGALPEELQRLLGNVPIVMDDYPSETLVRDGVDPRSLGLFAGTPFPEQGMTGAPPHLEQIFLFKRNLEREARSVDEVKSEVQITLMHEAGHFFGLEEDELGDLGLG